MPPAPTGRRSTSPARNVRPNNHKRGSSFEIGLIPRQKNDDLALFDDMENRARDNFFLQPTQDFDKNFGFKLCTSPVPLQGSRNDLLNADGEKNDYDWLLTPPDTPLFCSLDDETLPINLGQRGRSREQPISILKPTTSDKSCRTNINGESPHRLSTSPRSHRTRRCSASPHRLSASPQSRSSTFQSRGRPSSPHSSPPPRSRPITPSRRTLTHPTKPSTPGTRSSTPTSRGRSTVSDGSMALSGKRRTSPVNTSRGNSCSPKLQAWQSNIPGFSMDIPPNLRTSLADRPLSYVRGSSPVSRSRISSPSKFGKKSSSPTAHRSPSSSYSVEQDEYGSHGKGSLILYADDNIDSLDPTTMRISDYAAAEEVKLFPNSRPSVSSKKTSRILSTNSSMERSFDSTLRQTEQKSPQDMPRPLVSVPGTGAYTRKENCAHSTKRSSVTNSNNVSSEQGGSIEPDIDSSVDHDLDDISIERRKAAHPDTQDEVFNFDGVDEINEEVGHKISNGKCSITPHDFDIVYTAEIEPGPSEKFSLEDAAEEIIPTGTKPLYAEDTLSEVGCLRSMTCSVCSKLVSVIHLTEENGHVCPDCSKKGECIPAVSPETTVVGTEKATTQFELIVGENELCDMLGHHEIKGVQGKISKCSEKGECMTVVSPETEATALGTQNSTCLSELNVEEGEYCDQLGVKMRVYELQEDTGSTTILGHDEIKDEDSESCMVESSLTKSIAEEDLCIVNQQMWGQRNHSCTELELPNRHSCVKNDISEGAAISVLLTVSNSSNWHVVQGRSFNATNIPCDDPSSEWENPSIVKTSVGDIKALSVSSLDLSSSKQANICVRQQLSGRNVGIENFHHHLDTKSYSCGSSFSEILNVACNNCSSVRNLEYKALDETLVAKVESRSLNNTESDDRSFSCTEMDFFEGDEVYHTESCPTPHSPLDSSRNTANVLLEDISFAELPNRCYVSCVNAEELSNCKISISDIEEPEVTSDSTSRKEEIGLNNALHGHDLIKVESSSLLVMSSGDQENGNEVFPGPRSVCVDCPDPESITDGQDSSAPTTSDKVGSVSPLVSNVSSHTHGILVKVPRHGRSLTLEEVMDTTLFCRSIIQKLAYEATTTAVDKENVCLEGSSPMVTIVTSKASSDGKDLRARNGSRRTPKTLKARKRRIEKDVKTPSSKMGTNRKLDESLKHARKKVNSTTPSKPASKCNCVVM